MKIIRVASSLDVEIERLKSAIDDLRKNYQEGDYEKYDSLRRKLRLLEFRKRNQGYSPITLKDRDEVLKDLHSLNDNIPTHYRENIIGEMEDTGRRHRKTKDIIGYTKELGPKYRVDITGGVLYRGVTLEDWHRILDQGYLDTDGRGAIVPEDEQINLSPYPETAAEYIPSGHIGVVLAIDVDGLDLFMIDPDDYIRAAGRIPLKNIVSVSKPIGKDDGYGGMYLPDVEVRKPKNRGSLR